MSSTSHQTVKLAKGKHSTPEHGACVMELASMLAGEHFSDHPQSVSRPIAAFLRRYNDAVDDERRQDLYEYAARTVGTPASWEVEDLRVERLIQWGDEHGRHLPLPGWQKRRRGDGKGRYKAPEAAAAYVLHRIKRRINDGTHAAALALVDELIAMSDGPEWWAPAPSQPRIELARST